MYSLLPYTLHRVRDSRAARACPSSQAADNWKSCAGRPFPSPGAEPAAHRVEVHERCALDQVCPSRPTYASRISRATPENHSARAPRALHHIRSAAQRAGVHAHSRPTRMQVKVTAKSTASLVKLTLEMLRHAEFLWWRSGACVRSIAARRRSVLVGSVAEGTVRSSCVFAICS